MSATGKPLEGQVVAILGGSGSMGSATAVEVAALGGNPLLLGRSASRLAETVQRLPEAGERKGTWSG